MGNGEGPTGLAWGGSGGGGQESPIFLSFLCCTFQDLQRLVHRGPQSPSPGRQPGVYLLPTAEPAAAPAEKKSNSHVRGWSLLTHSVLTTAPRGGLLGSDCTESRAQEGKCLLQGHTAEWQRPDSNPGHSVYASVLQHAWVDAAVWAGGHVARGPLLVAPVA